MGNRLLNNECIRCGDPLIDLNGKWHMCSLCIKNTEEDLCRVKQQKLSPNAPRKGVVDISLLKRPESVR